jgi:demethylmenaquinone methyltransferase / 2-methoxy-6-polyprenyl-1,4-benzoquinol methylase
MSKGGSSQDSTTHFGFEQVAEHEKASKVGDVFDSVASQYDLMNDAMSMGVHRLWKRSAILMALLRPGDKVLDLASGTGDLAMLASDRVGPSGKVWVTDINRAMLLEGRNHLLDRGYVGNTEFLQVDAEALPFKSGSFDCVMMGFGLRNVTHKQKVLDEMHRVLVPGGRALVLEFSKTKGRWLSAFYDWYSFNVLPQLGGVLAGDKASYQYLVESIRMHPDQETLKGMFADAGFDRCQYHDFSGGIVALHQGVKT